MRSYEPFAVLEDDEVFVLGSVGNATPLDLDSASIAQLVLSSSELQVLDPSKVKDKYLFYGIVWSSSAGPEISLVRKKNARASISAGSFLGMHNGTLKKVDTPDFVLDSYADIIVHGADLYMMNENSARILLNDTGIASSGLSSNIQALSTVLGGTDALTNEATAAIEAVAKRKTNVARQLARLPEFFNGITVSPVKIRETALARCTDPDQLINASNRVCVAESRVEEFLDLLAGRLYLDTVTDEERRAERVSRRTR
ncbi:hypothetical protein HQO27_01575 [Rhodococcus fascians]|nr:hypothetical protein [Rhodococcus fascians]MBY4240587.1 hypothetical protein [Rhodococcus fascians]MBY4253461.1 hypothetical protein [Rhodococcus fascians]MBY4269098.1 hypothetical protein [Rhodococcus fascians]MBY4274528.1 hypothetical protein [Rhodococcus fascians]